MKLEKLYKAEYEDDEMQIFSAFDDEDAIEIAREYQKEKGQLLNVDEIDYVYDDIRHVL